MSSLPAIIASQVSVPGVDFCRRCTMVRLFVLRFPLLLHRRLHPLIPLTSLSTTALVGCCIYLTLCRGLGRGCPLEANTSSTLPLRMTTNRRSLSPISLPHPSPPFYHWNRVEGFLVCLVTRPNAPHEAQGCRHLPNSLRSAHRVAIIEVNPLLPHQVTVNLEQTPSMATWWWNPRF
jgi:hypothetical protein